MRLIHGYNSHLCHSERMDIFTPHGLLPLETPSYGIAASRIVVAFSVRHVDSVEVDLSTVCKPPTGRSHLKAIQRRHSSIMLYHRKIDCLLNQSWTLQVLSEWNPSGTGGFPSHKACNAEIVSLPWRHQVVEKYINIMQGRSYLYTKR